MQEEVLKEVKGLNEKIGKLADHWESKNKGKDEEIKKILDTIEKIELNQAKGADFRGARTVDADVMGMIEYARKGVPAEYMEQKTTGSVADPSTGGYLAAPVFVNKVFDALYNDSPIMANAEVIEINGNIGKLPIEAQEIQGNWTGELEEKADATWKLGMANIPVNEYIAPVPITNILLEDSNVVGIEQYITTRAAKAIDRAVGKSFCTGDGVNKPSGIFNNVLAANTVNSASLAGIPAAKLLEAMGKVPSEALKNAKWYMSASTFFATAAKCTADTSIIQLPMSTELPARIYGYPVVFVDGPGYSTANNIPAVFGDMFNAYKVVSRRGLNIQRDPYSRSKYGQTVLNFSIRVGGALVQPGSLAAIKATSS